MRIVVIALLGLSISGCSWLFHDSATDYLEARTHPPITIPAELGGKAKDPMLAIPDIQGEEGNEQVASEFVVPRPEPIQIEDEQDSTSLSSVQNTQIEPHLVNDGNGTPILRLGVDFPRAWSALGDALKKADIQIADLNRSIGTYYIEVEQPIEADSDGFFSWFSSDEPETAEYQIKLNRARSGVYIAIQLDSETLAEENTAQDLLNTIAENIK